MDKKNVHLEVDGETWKDFKAACAWYDISMKATLIKHIQNIVNDYRKARREFDTPTIYTNKKGKK